MCICIYMYILELPAKLLDYFLRSNKSNINPYIHMCICIYLCVYICICACIYMYTYKCICVGVIDKSTR